MDAAAEHAFQKVLETILQAERAGPEYASTLEIRDWLHLRTLPDELARLDWLQILDIRNCPNLSKISPIGKLKYLKTLRLAECRNITDLTPVYNLRLLRILDLSLCEEITDLEPLRRLAQLEDLDLYGCNKISSLEPIEPLHALEVLWLPDVASDLQVIRSFPRLRKLFIYHHQHQIDFAFLDRLAKLEEINLRNCSCLCSLDSLSLVPHLKALTLDNCGSCGYFETLALLLGQLHQLVIFETTFEDIPTSVCSQSNHENVVNNVRAHFESLRTGFKKNYDTKVLILGNAGVGKTQLCRLLCGKTFDPNTPSTPGARTHRSEKYVPNLNTHVSITYWDFGGQTIYHGSHVLFFTGRTVFLVLWNPEIDNRPGGRPLTYWLDLIRTFSGTTNPVVIVQSQCDNYASIANPAPYGNLDDFTVKMPGLYSSAKEGLGVGAVMEALTEAIIRSFHANPAESIGISRVRIQKRLSEIARDRPIIDETEFTQVCLQCGEAENTSTALEFFHNSGILYYRKSTLRDQVILDINWALNAIYSIFHTDTMVPIIHNNGRFGRNELGRHAWKDYSLEKQKALLGLMESSGMCFPTTKAHGEELIYIAPEFLPTAQQAKQTGGHGRVPIAPPDIVATARYEFLHEGILRMFLSSVGHRAGKRAFYWRYGGWLDKSSECQVLFESRWDDGELESGRGVIRFKAWGHEAASLLEPLLINLRDISPGQRPKISQKVRSGTVVIQQSSEIQQRYNNDLSILRPHRPTPIPRVVYISYAWGDQSSPQAIQREQIVDEFCNSLKRDSWIVHRDKQSMRPGDYISAFMKKISTAELLVAFLSDKYLRSDYCMAELHGAYRHWPLDSDAFTTHVVPIVLEDADISNLEYQDVIEEYWMREHFNMEKRRRKFTERKALLSQRKKKWSLEISEILELLNDVYAPRHLQTIKADDFLELRELLNDRYHKLSSQPAV